MGSEPAAEPPDPSRVGYPAPPPGLSPAEKIRWWLDQTGGQELESQRRGFIGTRKTRKTYLVTAKTIWLRSMATWFAKAVVE